MSIPDLNVELVKEIKEFCAQYTGKINYGNLTGPSEEKWKHGIVGFRFNFDDMWGSTDCVGLEYDLKTGLFRWDYGIYTNGMEEGTTVDRNDALDVIKNRIKTIPDYRKKHFIHFSKSLLDRFVSKEQALKNLEDDLVVTPEEMEFVREEVSKLYHITRPII